MLEKLSDEGYAEKAEGYYTPTFKAVLEYYKLKGCDGYLVKTVAEMVGRVSSRTSAKGSCVPCCTG
jgi:hypothetical protein